MIVISGTCLSLIVLFVLALILTVVHFYTKDDNPDFQDLPADQQAKVLADLILTENRE